MQPFVIMCKDNSTRELWVALTNTSEEAIERVRREVSDGRSIEYTDMILQRRCVTEIGLLEGSAQRLTERSPIA